MARMVIGYIANIDITGGSLIVSCMWYNIEDIEGRFGLCTFEFADAESNDDNDMRLFNELFGINAVPNYRELYDMGAPLYVDMCSIDIAAELAYTNKNDYIGVAVWLEEMPGHTHEINPNKVHGLCGEAYEHYAVELYNFANISNTGDIIRPAYWGVQPWLED